MHGVARRRGTVHRRTSNSVVGRLLVVLCSDLRFSCLNLGGIRRSIAVADVVTSGLETDDFLADLRAGDGCGVLCEADKGGGKHTACKDEAC